MPKRIGHKAAIQTTVRLDPDVIDRADALCAHLTVQRGLPLVRSDVLREAIMRGLRDLELEKAANRKR